MERQEPQIENKDIKWEGVEDPEFLAFLNEAEKQLVPFEDEKYEVRKTFYNCERLIYKQEKLSEVSSVNMSRKLDLLRAEGLIYFEEIHNSKVISGMLISDRKNLMLSLSFLYARESITHQNPHYTNIEKMADACKKSAQLWGQHPNAEIFKQGAYILKDPILSKKFMEEEAKKNKKYHLRVHDFVK